MNKRKAKIHALEDAAGILCASTDTLDTGLNDTDHYKVVVELERIAASLRNRALRLKLRDANRSLGLR